LKVGYSVLVWHCQSFVKIYLFFGIKVQIFFAMNFGALGFGTKTEGYLELEVMESQTEIEP
jgi:hypothetical protein